MASVFWVSVNLLPSRISRGVYTLLVLLLSGLAAPALFAQTTVSIERAMTKGPETAPVTIVEFSDYQ